MSKSLELAPFAVTTDGALLVNVATFARATDLASVMRTALKEKRAVFVGVALSPKDAELVMARLDNAADEAAARIVGQRRRRARGRP